MKTSALLSLLLLLSACASDDGFIDQRTIECAAGQDVTIQAGFDNMVGGNETINDQITLLVQVGNNTHGDIVVKSISAEQTPDDLQSYRLERGYRKFDQTIAEGEDHLFKIPMMGRATGVRNDRTFRSSTGLELNVRVGLENGDVYHCRFAVPSPRS